MTPILALHLALLWIMLFVCLLAGYGLVRAAVRWIEQTKLERMLCTCIRKYSRT